MADDGNIESKFNGWRAALLFALAFFTCGTGVSKYVYDQKAQHRQEIATLENNISKVAQRLTVEIERRADNELLVMSLEGSVNAQKMLIKQDRIRQENFIYQLSKQITDNRVMLSDWISFEKQNNH